MKGDPRTLKEALYKTIHRSDGLSVEQIAEQMNISPSYLARAALPDPDIDGDRASGVRFPLKQLIPLVRITGDMQVLDYIENSVGRVGITIAQPRETADEIQRQAIEAAVEFGELMKEVADSYRDSVLTTKERARISREGWQAIESIVKLVKYCEGK